MKLFSPLFAYLFIIQLSFGQSLFEDLPQLSTFTNNYLFSSYDPTGGNFDGYQGGNYLYETNRGSVNVDHPSSVLSDNIEYVMADVTGKGALKRFWNARYEITDTIRFYIDGSNIPQIEMTIDEIFYQKLPPFNEGLTYSYSENTGALYTYIPLFFDSSLIVTINNPIGYYHLNIELYGNESAEEANPANYYSELQALFSNAGSRPEYLENSTWDTLSFSLAPGEEISLFDKIGSYTVEALEIEIPEIDKVNSTKLLSDGIKVSEVKTSFKLKVNQDADNFKLRFRYFKKIGRNTTFVFVNNQYLDVWEINPSGGRDNTWLDYEFSIPKGMAASNDSIKIEFRPIEFAWSGFTYWMVCDDVITDSLDIGNEESEIEHSFFSQSTILAEEMRGRYDIDSFVRNTNSSILNNLNLKGFWEDELTPSIDAPLSYFFGMGDRDAPISNGICFGFNGSNFYNYYPMPFEKKGSLVLKNNNDSLSIENVKVRVAYSTDNNESKGKLSTQFLSVVTGLDDGDLTLLNTSKQGKMVGFVLNGRGPALKWLEGDERIYIDKLKTPLMYGTGTEDIFNGGDYFLLGERDLPIGSLNLSDRNYANMFRTFISDPINFRDGMLFNLQRGAGNDIYADYNSLVFYYSSTDEPIYMQTDYFNISQNIVSNPYNYNQYGGSYFNQAGAYEGTNDTEIINNKGYQAIDSSEFIVNIPTDNGGLILTRGMNYQNINQSASVYVNGKYVGVWLTSGKNDSKSWREDIFMIPPSFTNGTSSIKIEMKAISNNWSEMYYEINTVFAEQTIFTSSENSIIESKIDAFIYPNPMKDYSILSIKEPIDFDVNVTLIDVQGKIMRSYTQIKDTQLKIEKADLLKGLYLVNLTNSNNDSHLATLKLLVK